MKKIYSIIIGLIITTSTFSQIKYDDGPIVNSNNFVIVGTWAKNNISFRFINTTNDISAINQQNSIRQAFQIWADYANLNFTEVTSGEDLSISWAVGNHGDGAGNAFDGVNGVLAHAFFPPPNGGGTIAGDIHFDDAETWTASERPPFSLQPIDLVTVAAHEIGHALGLNHSNVACALMNPFYTGSHRYLAQDDIDGIRAIYGVGNSTPIRTANNTCFGMNLNINQLPTGATVTWASGNTLIATVGNTSGIVTRVNNGNGIVRFTATITLPCGVVITQFIDLKIGTSQLDVPMQMSFNGTQYNSFSSPCLPRVTQYLITVEPILGATSYYWSIGGPVTILSGQGTNTIDVIIGGSPGNSITFAVQGENACGRGGGITINGQVCGSGSNEEAFRVGPNPTTNSILIQSIDNKTFIKEVRILDKFSGLKKRVVFTTNTNTQNINLSGLLSDVYYFQIFDGTKWTTKVINKL